MIIECRQCRTKFRFNEAQLQEDGVWLRCGRCGHVFFQAAVHKTTLRPSETDLAPKEQPATDRHAEVPLPEAGHDGDVDRFMKDILHGGRDESIRDVSQKPIEAGDIRLKESDISEDIEDGLEDDHEQTDQQEMPPAKRKKKKTGWLWKTVLWSVLVVIAVPAVLSFVVFPEWGERYVRFFQQIAGTPVSQTNSESVTGYVQIQDIRQRIVSNYTLGHIRIIEGTAVNSADFPLARVLIEAEIVDAYSVSLGRRQSYAGNVLTEDELTTLSEDEILKKLSRPEGNRNLNERIPAGGRIPFMIVFTREPSGSIKTTVLVVGAERLL